MRTPPLFIAIFVFPFCLVNIWKATTVELGNFPDGHGFGDARDIFSIEESANVTLLKQRLNGMHTMNKTWERHHPMPHFFMHIPKTGGYYTHKHLSSMQFRSPVYNRLSPEERFRICQVGRKRKLKRIPSYKGIRCNAWMTENTFEGIEILPKHSYTIIRNPREHVLSQYFHCAEADDHIWFRDHMPSLDNWLTVWYLALNDMNAKSKTGDFECYNPTNLQSSHLGFDPDKGDGLESIQQKFSVIGPMDDMDKVLCVMFIHYTGWVPNCCRCDGDDANSNNNNKTNDKFPQLQYSHGVTHHGSTYNTTAKQDLLIKGLVQKDDILYAHVKTIFKAQSRLVEDKFNMTLCHKLGDPAT